MIQENRSITSDTNCTLAVYRPIWGRTLTRFDLKADFGWHPRDTKIILLCVLCAFVVKIPLSAFVVKIPHNRLNPSLLTLLRRKRELINQRHLTATGRIRTLHRPGPKPSNHLSVLCAFVVGFHHRIKIANPFKSLIPHPLTVIAHICGQSLGPFPGRNLLFLARIGINRRFILKLGRNLDQSLSNQHRHRIEVTTVGLQTQALGLQRNGTTTTKRVIGGGGIFSDIIPYSIRFSGGFFPTFPSQTARNFSLCF